MDLFRPIDIYCERIDPGVWAEPLNAVSNAAFLVAGVLLWRRLAAQRPWESTVGTRRYLQALAALVCCIGIGSALFHTTAQVWSMIFDVLFITVFIYAFFGFFLRFVAGLEWRMTVPALAVFFALNLAVERGLGAVLAPEVLNRSEAYLPPLIALAATGAYMARRGCSGSRLVLLAAGVFAVSLTFRSLDQRLCTVLPVGTHFLWHLLNALTLYLAVLGMRDATARNPRPNSV